MKIVFLARYLPQEGSTTHMYTLAEGLIKRGHEVHLISAGPKEDASAKKIFFEAVKKGMVHHTVDFPLNPSFTLLGKINQFLKYLKVIPIVLQLLFKLRPDVIHVHYPVTSYLAKLYGYLTGKKFVTTHHTSGIPKHPLHKKADYVIAISSELEWELINNYHYRKEQVKLIFNGVSMRKFNNKPHIKEKLAIKEQLGFSKKSFLIGYIGTFNKNKGIDILLEAASKIKDMDYSISLVGDGDIEWVNSLITKYRLKENVKLYPFQDPVKFYKAYDVLVLPSRREGFGLVPIEAMMMGVPVIRSNVQGATDQVDHGVNGYIFKSEDAMELYYYLDILMKDKNLLMDMGEKANKKSVALFTDKVMLDKLLNLYNEVINS